MTNYRRNFVPGGSFFFTVDLANRRSHLLMEKINLLREALRYVRAKHPFMLDAIVVLPDHLHAIWTLPLGDADSATRWRLLKTIFPRGVPVSEGRSISREGKSERGGWQRRYWEHTLRDENDFERHCDYIHINPVKHGYVSAVHEWPFTSYHGFVKRGVYRIDWAGSGDVDGNDFGER